jgi:hypothetical protein
MSTVTSGQNINQSNMRNVSNEATDGLQQGATETTQEGQAAVEARLAGHAIAQMGKALDALDKAII